MGLLHGKVALITDSESILGKTIAESLIKEGAVVTFSKVEVNQDTVKIRVGEIVEKYGKIDILINNDSLKTSGLIHETSDQAWGDMLKINVKVPFLWTQAASRAMVQQKSGRIVTIASNCATMVKMDLGAFSVSQATLLHAMRVAALELAQHGITVNCICPGVINGDEQMTESEKNEILGDQDLFRVGIPVGRFVEPQEIADQVVLLASDRASAITGGAHFIDGGQACAQGGA